MGEPSVINDEERLRNLNKEYAQLEDVVAGFQRFQQVTADLAAVLEMLDGDDADMRAMAQEELSEAKAAVERIEQQIKDTHADAVRASGHQHRRQDMSKPLTKTQFVAALADKMGTDKKTASAALDALADVVTSEVVAGGAVTLPGLLRGS